MLAPEMDAAAATHPAVKRRAVRYLVVRYLRQTVATVRSLVKARAIPAATHAIRGVYAAATGGSIADVIPAADATVKAVT
jgi:hypothetical protein